MGGSARREKVARKGVRVADDVNPCLSRSTAGPTGFEAAYTGGTTGRQESPGGPAEAGSVCTAGQMGGLWA